MLVNSVLDLVVSVFCCTFVVQRKGETPQTLERERT
nr:MAG TPA: hypothetical protein [Caudoviricetes sp.]